MSKTNNKYDKFYTYKITNLLNNKIYIGETHNFNARLNKHFASAKCGSQTYLHRAIRKYGNHNFVIEELGEFDNEVEALNNEIYLISQYKSNDPNIGYNLTSGGDKTTYNQYVIDKLSEKSLSLWQNKDFVLNSFYGQTKLTIEDIIEIFELRKNKVKIKDIALIYSKHRSIISNILRKEIWKIIIPCSAIIEKDYEENIIYDVRNKVNSGLTYKEISSILDISIHTIRKMAKGYGSYAKFNVIPPITNLKIIDENIINSIRTDFIKNHKTFKALSEEYKICSEVIADIIYATNHYNYLMPLIKKEKRSKFTEEEIIIIDNLFKNKEMTITELSKKYRTDYKTIYNIVNNKSYKHIER